MAGPGGMLLFQRGDEDDSDIWDDTALVEAYDKAVNPMKAQLAAENGDPSILENGSKGSSAHSKKKKNKKKKSRQSKRKQQAQVVSSSHWTVGDLCRAVYTEDGEVYEAKIISIDSEDSACTVRYLGYGNEEEQSLDDLIPVDAGQSKHRQRPSSCSESESDASSVHSSASMKNSKKPKSARGWPWPGFSSGMHPPPPPPPPPPHFMQGPPGSGAFPMPGPMGGLSSMPFPTIPPPPPPMPSMTSGNPSNENDALCSMLLSWYMSGYHTGYYQGLLHGRQHSDASGAMGPSR